MKRKLKLAFQIIAVLLIVILLAALITGGMILYRGLGTKGTFTYMIVLGTAVEGTEPSPMLSDRIEAAAKYMQENPHVIAIATGYKAEGDSISEAQCIYNGLTALGIAPERILIEDKATSTIENFQYALDLLEQELGRIPQNIGVLSSEFHLLRARMIAADHGIDAVTVAAHTSDTKAFFTYFLREILVVWYDGLKIALS